MSKIQIKRVYDDPAGDDGFRIYVDRLWPRGESKETFHYDVWAKDVAPSTELREWFHADPDARWDEFRERYTDELARSEAARSLSEIVGEHSEVTLLYSSRDREHNNAAVLAEYLRGNLRT